MSVTEAAPPVTAFAAERAWRLNPQVALRDEAFGALAYHYGTRRLVFLKSRLLVDLVSSLGEYPSAAEAITALVPEGRRTTYERALARLAASGVIDVG
ncbi:MAG: mycofactocin biosynthesis chaperone MftB [Acidimicrobiales bacterium]